MLTLPQARLGASPGSQISEFYLHILCRILIVINDHLPPDQGFLQLRSTRVGEWEGQSLRIFKTCVQVHAHMQFSGESIHNFLQGLTKDP